MNLTLTERTRASGVRRLASGVWPVANERTGYPVRNENRT